MKTFISWIGVLLLALPCSAEGRFVPAGADGIAGEYMVLLDDEPAVPVAQAARALLAGKSASVGRVWQHALRGFSARMDEATARQVAKLPGVRAVYQNTGFSVPVQDCYGGISIADPMPAPVSPQSLDCADPDPQNPDGVCVDNWGLDRIDQRTGPRDHAYHFRATGTGVHVYLVDTGIFAGHDEFQDADGLSRVTGGVNIVDPSDPDGPHDCTYWSHGTHVAGIIGGRRYGVAKNVQLHPVKIWDCAGSIQIDDLVTAYDWIAANHDPDLLGTGVANMSINGSVSDFVDPDAPLSVAIRGAIASGVLVSHSAGNQQEDACDWSAYGSGAMVVGGVDEFDTIWERTPGDPYYSAYCGADCGSNNGSCVDIWAPSAHIISSWYEDQEHPAGFCRLSGTSMAAPHVTGTAALYLENHPHATPEEAAQALLDAATSGVLDDSIGTGAPDKLLCAYCLDCPDEDGDGHTADECGGTDCDDADEFVHPEAEETTCDGKDNDCNAETPDDLDPTDADGDGYSVGCGADCDDTDPAVHPDAAEITCDEVDNDCDPATPDDPDPTDADSDGHTAGCGDCDDTNPDIHPGATEVTCDGADNDCNAETPEDPDPTDADTDGYSVGCGADCDDTNPDAHPGAAEVACDGADNDCNAETPDDPDPTDSDDDGHTTGCGDCDDTNADIHPGAAEVACDGRDNDCNAETPDDPEPADADGDGLTAGCGGDCDDTDPDIHPGASEIPCDGVDNDCDPQTADDPDPADADSDGHTAGCGDCDDADPDVHPGAEETCDDELDNDCNGLTDADDPACDGGGDGGCGCGRQDRAPDWLPLLLALAGLAGLRRRHARFRDRPARAPGARS